MIEQRVITLRARGNRRVEVTLFVPSSGLRAAVPLIFSHGLNSSPDRYHVLFDAWAGAGFLVCAPLHIDSEDHPQRNADDRLAVRQTRLEDYTLVAASLTDGVLGAPVKKSFVAAGHSYGALIAQVTGGAVLEGAVGMPMPDIAPPACVIALSPPPPIPNLASERTWSSVDVPMLCVTGTRDMMPGFVDDWRSHLASHRAAPRSFAIIFDGMDHYFNGAFGRLGHARSEAAIGALNDTIIAFARRWTRNRTITAKQWIKERTPGALRLI